MELVAFELIHIFLLVIKRSAIINWATIISLSSDMLPIPAHNVSRVESWIHSEAPCVIWQRSGALVTPHLIKRNWLWRSSCRPSSPLCLSVGLAQDDGPDFATPANTPRSEDRAGEMKYWYCQFIALKHNGEQKALSSARNVGFHNTHSDTHPHLSPPSSPLKWGFSTPPVQLFRLSSLCSAIMASLIGSSQFVHFYVSVCYCTWDAGRGLQIPR